MKIEASKGSNIYDSIRTAKTSLRENGFRGGILVFNEIELMISANSLDEDIATIYFLKHKLNKHNLLND